MSIDLYFSNTALYQDSVKVFRERSCCSKERNKDPKSAVIYV